MSVNRWGNIKGFVERTQSRCSTGAGRVRADGNGGHIGCLRENRSATERVSTVGKWGKGEVQIWVGLRRSFRGKRRATGRTNREQQIMNCVRSSTELALVASKSGRWILRPASASQRLSLTISTGSTEVVR